MQGLEKREEEREWERKRLPVTAAGRRAGGWSGQEAVTARWPLGHRFLVGGGHMPEPRLPTPDRQQLPSLEPFPPPSGFTADSPFDSHHVPLCVYSHVHCSPDRQSDLPQLTQPGGSKRYGIWVTLAEPLGGPNSCKRCFMLPLMKKGLPRHKPIRGCVFVCACLNKPPRDPSDSRIPCCLPSSQSPPSQPVDLSLGMRTSAYGTGVSHLPYYTVRAINPPTKAHHSTLLSDLWLRPQQTGCGRSQGPSRPGR